jgi:predicted ATPase
MLGYGITQLLPIIMKVSMSTGFTFVIEEPESNLHPALQSKLADFFNELKSIEGKSDHVYFLIETHSEYLIRKFQYLTASPKSNLSPQDSVLYYFYDPKNIPPGQPQVQKININSDGSLTNDFGSGFFDEADNIGLDIWKLNNSQKN